MFYYTMLCYIDDDIDDDIDNDTTVDNRLLVRVIG